jgi:hypothetical protein
MVFSFIVFSMAVDDPERLRGRRDAKVPAPAFALDDRSLAREP